MLNNITSQPDRLAQQGENILNNVTSQPDRLLNQGQNTITSLQNMPGQTLSQITGMPDSILNQTTNSLNNTFSMNNIMGGSFSNAFGGLNMNNVDSYPTQAFSYIQNNATSKANSLASRSLSKMKTLGKDSASAAAGAVIGAAWNQATDLVSGSGKTSTAQTGQTGDKTGASGTTAGTQTGQEAAQAAAQAQAIAAEQEKLNALKEEVRQNFFVASEATSAEQEAIVAARDDNFSDIVAKSATLAEGMRESIVADAATTTATPISGASMKEDINMNTDIMKKLARQLVAEIAVQNQLFELEVAGAMQSLDAKLLEMPTLQTDIETGA